MTTQRIAVIGAGGWGTAVALLLLENGHDVVLWGHDAVYVDRMLRERENAKFLSGIPLPADLRLTSDVAEAVAGARVVVSAVPTRWVRATLGLFAGHVRGRVPLVSLTKGIEVETLKRPTEVLQELLPGHGTAVLSGPSHAEEVAARIPTSCVLASRTPSLARRLQPLFTTEMFRVYTNTDPVGVELGGALKNVIAIAAGVCDGLRFGDNTKAALLTRGLVEMKRLAVAMGAKKDTLVGLAGIGDLITTSFSKHGRNRAVGERLGRGMPLERILAEMEKVAEGVHTTPAVMKLARRHRVEMPITREVNAVLFENKEPADALRSLMSRGYKNERW